MKPFRFRLQRVLDFRRTQFQLAENDYRRAQAAVLNIQEQQATLAARKQETRISFSQLPDAMGYDLEHLPDWYRWTTTEAERLTRLEAQAVTEVENRRRALIEAAKNPPSRTPARPAPRSVAIRLRQGTGSARRRFHRQPLYPPLSPSTPKDTLR